MVSAFKVAALSRSGFWFSSTARSPNLALCSKQRGEVARGGAVVALHLVEEDPERLAPLGRQLGPPARGVQQVEEQQVGD